MRTKWVLWLGNSYFHFLFSLFISGVGPAFWVRNRPFLWAWSLAPLKLWAHWVGPSQEWYRSLVATQSCPKTCSLSETRVRSNWWIKNKQIHKDKYSALKGHSSEVTGCFMCTAMRRIMSYSTKSLAYTPCFRIHFSSGSWNTLDIFCN